jgi:hypothetical protein
MRLDQPSISFTLGGVDETPHVLVGVNIWMEVLWWLRLAGWERTLCDIVPCERESIEAVEE